MILQYGCRPARVHILILSSKDVILWLVAELWTHTKRHALLYVHLEMASGMAHVRGAMDNTEWESTLLEVWGEAARHLARLIAALSETMTVNVKRTVRPDTHDV